MCVCSQYTQDTKESEEEKVGCGQNRNLHCQSAKTVERKDEKQMSIVAADKSGKVGKKSNWKRMDEVEADKVDKGKLMRKPKSMPAYMTNKKWMGQSQKGPFWPRGAQRVRSKVKKVSQSSLSQTKEME